MAQGTRQFTAIALAAALAVTGGPAFAFGTIRALGQHAEHAQITKLALAGAGFGARTLSVLAGGEGRFGFGAVGAPDRPNRGLLSDKAAHCDGGDHLERPGYPQSAETAQAVLAGCRRRMFEQMTAAVSAAGGLVDVAGQDVSGQAPPAIACRFEGAGAGESPARCRVIEALGQALHASQDFYAHTNWVDLAAPGEPDNHNPPGLERQGAAGWIDPATPDAPSPRGLISGCYDGFPEAFHCAGHTRHKDLNKDKGLISASGSLSASVGTTRRGKIEGNFGRAVAAAVADTAARWSWFEAQLIQTYGARRGARALCLIRSDPGTACPPAT